MGLKIKAGNTYEHTVEVNAQGLRGTFVAHFERLNDEQLAEVVDGFREKASSEESTTADLFQFRRETLERYLAGVDGIADDSGTLDRQAAKAWVIQNPAAALSAFDALIDTQTSAAAKNLKPSRQR